MSKQKTLWDLKPINPVSDEEIARITEQNEIIERHRQEARDAEEALRLHAQAVLERQRGQDHEEEEDDYDYDEDTDVNIISWLSGGSASWEDWPLAYTNLDISSETLQYDCHCMIMAALIGGRAPCFSRSLWIARIYDKAASGRTGVPLPNEWDWDKIASEIIIVAPIGLRRELIIMPPMETRKRALNMLLGVDGGFPAWSTYFMENHETSFWIYGARFFRDMIVSGHESQAIINNGNDMNTNIIWFCTRAFHNIGLRFTEYPRSNVAAKNDEYRKRYQDYCKSHIEIIESAVLVCSVPDDAPRSLTSQFMCQYKTALGQSPSSEDGVRFQTFSAIVEKFTKNDKRREDREKKRKQK
jgi:hypothetical protein